MSDFRNKIRSKFTPDELDTYRNNFDIFDLNGDGAVSAKELNNVSRHLGYRLTKDDIKVRPSYRRVTC
jgi:Ca2+-binding EF-hand superfamily protein